MFSKKIFDIVPPEQISEEEAAAGDSNKPFPFSFEKKRFGFNFSFVLKAGLLLSLPILFVAGLIFGFISFEQKITIKIWPKTKISNFTTEFIVDKEILEPKFAEAALPGEIYDAESFISEEFPSTGISYKEGKARGTIAVYNAFSTYSQPLVANTRFVSAEGKLFRSVQKTIIPPAGYEKGKLVPASIDVEVAADQPGPEYNIGPSVFSIPGFAGTPKYTGFYGKSVSAMAGGRKAEVRAVSQNDAEDAGKIVEAKAIQEAKNLLKNKLPPDFLMADESVFTEISESFALAKVGQETDAFVYQARAKAQGLIFKKADIEEFAKDYLLARISSKNPPENFLVPAEQTFQEESLKFNYFLKKINLKTKISFALEISAKTFFMADDKLVKEKIRGRNHKEIYQYISEIYPDARKIEIDFQPFWSRIAPEDIEKITIELNLGDE